MLFVVPQESRGASDVASSFNLQSLSPVWLSLHIAGGQVGLPLAVFIITVLSRSASRSLTLINFCITWIIYSIVYCLLLYSGEALHNATAPSKLCLAQAALIHGAPPMAAVAGLEMVLKLWCDQKRLHRGDIRYIQRLPGWLVNLLIILPPYLAFLIFSLMVMALEMHDSSLVLSLNRVYCSVQSYRFSLIVPSFCAVMMAGIIVVEGVIFYDWYQVRKEVANLFKAHPRNELLNISRQYQPRNFSLSMGIRIALFTLYSVATLSACIVFVANKVTPFPYMVEASLPLAVFILFGTQKDMLNLWLCSKRQGRKTSTTSTYDIPSARPRLDSRFNSIESILAPSSHTSSSSTIICETLTEEPDVVQREDIISTDEKKISLVV